MAGYWPQSRSQIHDQNGKPFIGALATFYKGGTTTPITVYRDNGLTTPHPNPVTNNGNGTFPGVFLDEADEFYRVRVTTAGGVLLYDDDGIPIIGPSTGGGGPPPTPVDPDSVAQTGDIIFRYDTGLRTGFVRLNGRSIGTATSGASERANSDTQPLFEFLWNRGADVTGGRGVSAAADWAANKPLVLPDARGKAPAGLDTMGNIAAGVLTGFTTLGQVMGAQNVTLTVDQMPTHAHSASSGDSGLHDHQNVGVNPGSGSTPGVVSGTFSGNANSTVPNGLHSHPITVDPVGGGAAHSNVQPIIGMTFYIRL